MAVRIVTDSTSDITAEEGAELGITVIPLTVLFGRDSYLDRVTITTDEFYRRLTTEDVFPTTTQPPPSTYAEVYSKLADETDEILIITLSAKLSGTYQSAVSAIDMVDKECRIEVIDSQLVAMGQGLVVLAAASAAQQGAKLDELVDFVRDALGRCHWITYFDTLKYLAKGGRIGKAQGLLGSVLSFKPILTVKEGEIHPVTRLRSKGAGIEYLYNFVGSFQRVEQLAVEHTTLPDEADRLGERLGGAFPEIKVRRATVSPVLGAHGGPGAIAVAVLEAR